MSDFAGDAASTLDAAGASDRVGSEFFAFQNTYARLPQQFYARVQPMPVAAPALVKLNAPLAQ